jgi:hypothetical protein
MKIINRKQFLKAPVGTIYSKFKPCIIDGLYIKNESLNNDWYYQDLIDSIECNYSGEYTDKLFKAKDDSKYELRQDYDVSQRDGLFDEEQLFLIYDKDDVVKLTKALLEAICIERMPERD